MDLIAILSLILAIGYIAYIVFEKVYYEKIRKSFKYVIHVNGIRGKSTTTRLIDAGFRNCGYRVFSKTTGTIPTMIDTNNNDVVIKRLGNANIREQLKMLRKAYKEKAEVLILECMAVNPELQKICEEKMLKADICIITNVRMDHIQDMGENLQDIADAFCNTIPTNGTLIVNHSDFDNTFTKRADSLNTKVIFSTLYDGDNLQTFEENIALSLSVAKELNLDESTFFEGMKHYHHDVGAFTKIKYKETLFLNGLSINDPMSIKIVYDKIIKEYDLNDITILLNSRSDRPTRVLQHIEMIEELPCKKWIIFGSNPSFISKKIKKKYPNIVIEKMKNISDLENEKIVFAIGNIGGKGMKVLDYFKENGVTYD